MKKITLLFCAGCGAGFNTREIFYTLKEALSGSCELTSKVFIKEDEEYDLLVIVNGCNKNCIEADRYGGNVLVINEENFEDATELVRQAIS